MSDYGRLFGELRGLLSLKVPRVRQRMYFFELCMMLEEMRQLDEHRYDEEVIAYLDEIAHRIPVDSDEQYYSLDDLAKQAALFPFTGYPFEVQGGDPEEVQQSLEALANSPHLRFVKTLSCHDNVVDQHEVFELLMRSPYLTGLEAIEFHTMCTDDFDDPICFPEGIGDVPTLKKLTIGSRQHDNLGLDEVRDLFSGEFPALEALEIHAVYGLEFLVPGLIKQELRDQLQRLILDQPSEQDIISVARGLDMPRLRALGLVGSELSADAARVLSEGPGMSHIQSLDLGNMEADMESVKRIMMSSTLPSLRALELKYNGAISEDDGFFELLNMPELKRLISLGLSGTGLGDEHARALANSPHLSQLESLDLSENDIGDEGARALANSPYLTKLGRLELGDNPIGTSGVEALTAPSSALELGAISLRVPDDDISWERELRKSYNERGYYFYCE